MTIKPHIKSITATLSIVLLLSSLLLSCFHKKEIVIIDKSPESNYTHAQVEPSIYVNRLNPNEIIAGTVLNDYYRSKNGGSSWESFVLNSPHGVNGDPVLLIDDQNNFYYFHLSNPKDGSWLDRIVCQRSNNIDSMLKTVGHTAVNGKVHDKHWVAYNSNTRTLHLAWTQFDAYKSDQPADSSTILYSRSRDFGESWSEPIRISSLSGNCLDNSGTIEGVSICVGLNNDVYVAYCLKEQIHMSFSKDDGSTWLQTENPIASQKGGWSFDIPGIYRMNGFPSLQMDVSNSPNRGRLYLSWSDQIEGKDNTNVWISHSDDQGKTWSSRKKVNNDKGDNHQFMSAMRVDEKTGTVACLFYDRRNSKNIATNIYIAFSKDGSKTFENKKINNKHFVPDANRFFGDYLGLDVFNDVIYALWPEMHSGKIILNFRKVKV